MNAPLPFHTRMREAEKVIAMADINDLADLLSACADRAKAIYETEAEASIQDAINILNDSEPKALAEESYRAIVGRMKAAGQEGAN